MNEISTGFLVFILFLCLLCSAFFSASETAMMALNRYKLAHLVKQGNKKAALAQSLLEKPDRLLGTILLGNNFVNILATSVGTLIGVRLFGELGVAVATVVLTVLVLILSEITPKTLASQHADSIALPIAKILKVCIIILYPLVAIINRCVDKFLNVLHIKKNVSNKDTLTDDELKTVVLTATSKKNNKEDSNKIKRDMLVGILELSDTTVEELMIPRTEIEGIDLNLSDDEIIKQIHQCHHSRMPVYRGSLENMEGFLNLRDVMFLYDDNAKFQVKRISSILQECVYIPNSTPLKVQINNYRKDKSRSGLVVDEYGDIKGMFSLEDITSYLIGNLDNSDGMTQEIQQIEPDLFKVNGTVALRVLNRELNLNLPIDEATTLSGLVVETLGNFPENDTEVDLPGCRIKVEKFDHGVVEKAEIRILSEQTQDED